ncbi:cysteine desulfurase family protein [Microlunatus parietis]|uniref:Cysteine desulfurase n=1 Tax=Microlunatus parietis TaxID=682979 RepID=A0A7Y9I5T5_9ACTN|nr:aminotransferase class V-fold PLP-dependent enzyme [Microlunatus parietis]NYE70826.1 cysteine desulfurase [Microlunatus parietis]
MTGPIPTVFLDASTAEPLLPEARQAWLAAQDSGWGDPLRLHRAGRLAAQALDRARELVAEAVGARPDEVVFTGPGPQTAAAAIDGLALGRRRIGRTMITSAIEHSAVLAATETAGEAVRVGVDHAGRIDLDAWAAAVSRPGVAAAVLQVANHEVGTLQPYAEAAAACRAAEVPLIVDATAALGRIDLTRAGPWSIMIGSAAAFGGPASVGFMIIRRGVRWRAPYPVDDYQDGRWPGPPDVPAIVAAVTALQTWLDQPEPGVRQHALIDRLRAEVAARISDVEVVGDPIRRVPHLLTFSVLYVDGETLTLELDRAGIAVASGSACSASAETPSHVLAAMGALTHGNVRIGLTRSSTEADVDRLLDALPPIVDQVRARLGAP